MTFCLCGRGTTARRVFEESIEALVEAKIDSVRYFLYDLGVLEKSEKRLAQSIEALERCLKVKSNYTRARKLLDEARKEVGN